MTETLFEVRGLSKHYFGVAAVAELSFSIPAGAIVGLIGPNGSGKSTTIDCISGFQPPDAGRWFLAGAELTGAKPHLHSAAGLARTFQAVRAYEGLSLRDNLAVAAQAHDGVGWWADFCRSPRLQRSERAIAERADELLGIVGLADYSDAPAAILSYGQRKLLAIAAAMMTRPKLVVLDEPVAGVNPTMIRRIEAAIRELNADGAALLIVEHNVGFIMNLCQTVIVLEQGCKIAEGPPSLIREDPRVLAAYLGAELETGADG